MPPSPARRFSSDLFPYDPKFVPISLDGRRFEMSFVEAGPLGVTAVTAAPVVLLHGNPTWSFLYREVIPRLSGKHRVIAPDLLGFGRSDKLDRYEDYTLERHISSIEQLVLALDLRDITLVVHDWAGPIGLSFAVDHPDRVARLVIMNTWAFAPEHHNRVPQPLATFRKRPHGELLVLGLNAFVEVALPFGIVRRPGIRSEVMRAYRAPFPDWTSRWPVLAFPRQIPLAPGDAAFERMKRTDMGLRTLAQPTMLLWGRRDTVFPPRVMRKFKERLTNVKHTLELDAHHFLQEDRGLEIGDAIASFLTEA